MKRWLAKIVVFLLFGGITTIAVAWAFALKPNFSASAFPASSRHWGKYLRPSGDWLWDVFLLEKPGASRLHWTMPWVDRPPDENEYHSLPWASETYQQLLEHLRQPRPGRQPQRLWVRAELPSWSRLRDTPEERMDREFRRYRYEYAFGWPGLALSYRFECDWPGKYADPSLERSVGALHIGSRLPLTSWTGYLPLRVLWSGFVVDSLLYAVGWFVALGGVALTRLGLRRYRGKCVKCGYDLRGAEHEACPECGVEV